MKFQGTWGTWALVHATPQFLEPIEDDNQAPRTVDFEPKSAVEAGMPMVAVGRYQIIVRREDEVYTYPKTGPLALNFEYDLADEVQ